MGPLSKAAVQLRIVDINVTVLVKLIGGGCQVLEPAVMGALAGVGVSLAGLTFGTGVTVIGRASVMDVFNVGVPEIGG